MVKCQGFTRWALGILLLLGACGSTSPDQVLLEAPPASVPESGLRPADAAGVSSPLASAAERAAPDEATERDGWVASTPLVSSAGDGEVDEILADLKAEVPAPAAGPSSIVAPDRRAAAAAVAARPPGTAVGYLLIDLESGSILAELNPDLPLIPASTTKLATAVVALDVLGPEYRYRTDLLARGPIEQGVLRGDLILRGGGDPMLDLADLLGLAIRLETLGIYRVDGRFLIDDSALPRLSEIAPTQPLEAAYNPSIGALSLAFNRVRVAWSGGGRIQAAALPPLYEAQFQAASPARLPPGGVALASDDGEVVVWRVADRGRRRQVVDLPVKDPGLHVGYVFRQLASAQGILLSPPVRGITPAGATVLAVHESAPLGLLMRDMLLYSNNMMAEMIGLSAAARLGDVSGGLQSSGELTLAHLRRMMPDVDWRGAVLANHSGLDAAARLTPRQLAAIARYGWHQHALPALLPGGGWSGTLIRRFNGPDSALRVWAKTGTLKYGSALAGYLFPLTDRPAVFVTMVSDTGAREAYDALLPYPGPKAQAAANAWLGRAQGLQNSLVESWLLPMPTS